MHMSVFSSVLFCCWISSIVKSIVLNMRWHSKLNVVLPKGCLLKNDGKKTQLSILLSLRAAHKNVNSVTKVVWFIRKLPLVNLLFNESLIQWTPSYYFSDVCLIINMHIRHCVTTIAFPTIHFPIYVCPSLMAQSSTARPWHTGSDHAASVQCANCAQGHPQSPQTHTD